VAFFQTVKISLFASHFESLVDEFYCLCNFVFLIVVFLM
jgi:hypothetical protein